MIDLLQVEEIDRDVFCAPTVFDNPSGLFGGQVAAQALRAASCTVTTDRVAHSLHGYFLRAGDPSRPVVFEVHRDRDGRSYSSRRVIARQEGDVIFTMATSFHRAEDGPDVQVATMPDVCMPDELVDRIPDHRTLGLELLATEMSVMAGRPWRMWGRATEAIGTDVHLQACVLTYLSDKYSGIFSRPEATANVALSSLDHALWFYRPVRVDEWVLVDLIAESVAAGRALYRGRIFAQDGTLVAGLAQESLFRKLSRPWRSEDDARLTQSSGGES